MSRVSWIPNQATELDRRGESRLIFGIVFKALSGSA